MGKDMELGKIYVLSPLINFISDVEKIKISKNLSICLPTKEERKLIEKDFIHRPMLFSWQLVIRSVLPLRYKNEQLLIEHYDFQAAAYQSCTALRLYKEGTVGLGPQYLMSSPPLRLVAKLGRDNINYLDTLGKYFLKSSEVKDFISLYKEIEHLDNSKYRRIQIAILRFEFSYNIGLIYQLIDLMIAFEALYIGDDKELAYKMATRASFLLGKTKEERTKIFNLLKKAYTLRGKLVHGGDLPKNFEISIEFISQVRKLLRDSIKKFMVLLDLYSHRELLNSILDNNVLHEGSILD